MPNEQHSLETLQFNRGNASRLAEPARVLEGQWGPRMLLRRRPEPVQELTRLLLNHESAAASAYVEMLRQNGARTEEICLQLLPAAARQLGQLWEEDRCGFAEVTMGVCILHQVLQRMSPDEVPCPQAGREGQANNNVLLTCLPGEQHTFGVLLVAQFLRRAGWSVRCQFPVDTEELVQSVRKKSFSIIGVSIGRYSRAGDLTLLIRALRRASINPRVIVLVGGPVLALRPELGWQVGADATAIDAPEAVSRAQGYWQPMPART